MNSCLDTQESEPVEVHENHEAKRKNVFDALGLIRDSKRKKVEAKSKNRPSLTQLLIEEKRIRNRFDVERHAEGGEEIPNNIKEEEEGSSSLEDGGIAEIEENQNVSQRGGENHHISQGGDPEVLEISANNPEPLNNSEVVIEQVSKLADSSLSKDHLNQTTNAEVIIPSTSSDQTETQTSLPQSLQGLAPTKSNNSQASDKFENSQPTKKPIHSQPSHPLHIPKSQNISSPTRNASQNAYQEKSIATTLSHNLHSRGSHVPLAHLLRPQTLADFQGQETLLGKNGLLRNIIHADHIPSFLLWGPPGVGKTSLARIIARSTNHKFVEVSGAESSAKRLKEIFQQSENETKLTGRQTILFLDEIHRFNKAVQDLLLPVIEKGVVTVIGATTENPSFTVNNALLSRMHTFVMEPLGVTAILKILTRALFQVNKFRKARNLHLISLTRDAMKYIAELSLGDSRTAINILECINAYLSMYKIDKENPSKLPGIVNITDDMLKQLFKSRHFHQLYDKSGESHYDTISAFHKSVRGSDANAALFYLVKMLIGGEDPLFLIRRMIVIASEDIGLRDSSCLPFVLAAKEAFEFIGMPEGEIILAHCAVKLARAPKSTKSYRALRTVQALMSEKPEISKLPVPIHLRNAPTKLMKELGYGNEYKYNPEFKYGKVKQTYLPKEIEEKEFLEETHLGRTEDVLVKKEVYEKEEMEEKEYEFFKKRWREVTRAELKSKKQEKKEEEEEEEEEEEKKEDNEKKEHQEILRVESTEENEHTEEPNHPEESKGFKEPTKEQKVTENTVSKKNMPNINIPISAIDLNSTEELIQDRLSEDASQKMRNELILMREELNLMRNELASMKTRRNKSDTSRDLASSPIDSLKIKTSPKLIRRKTSRSIPRQTYSYDENLSKEDQPEYFDGNENDLYSDDPDCTSNFDCPYDEFYDGNSQPEYFEGEGSYYDPELE